METENLTNNNPTPEEIKNNMQDKSCEHKK